MNDLLLSAHDVTKKLGIADSTLQAWYKFKKENPDNEYAMMLPEIIRVEPRNKRCWKESDIQLLMTFQKSIPHGKNGVLGSVTQRYQKKGNDTYGKCGKDTAGTDTCLLHEQV